MDGRVLVQGEWITRDRAPYLAHLKVMRRVLEALRAEVGPGGTVGAYVFLDDRFAFVAEGTGDLAAAAERARREADRAFRAENGVPLWGECFTDPVTGTLESAVADLARLPADAGLADRPEDYPWCGGRWLVGKG